MSEIKVVYWSGTGNTQTMAEAVAEGIKEAGSEGKVFEVTEVSPEDLAGDKVVALGCPAMGSEVLEEDLFEPFMEELEKSLEGKVVGLFGAYGWGDGEWMRDWEERIKSHGGRLICDGVMSNEEPDDDVLKQCRDLGEKLAKA